MTLDHDGQITITAPWSVLTGIFSSRTGPAARPVLHQGAVRRARCSPCAAGLVRTTRNSVVNVLAFFNAPITGFNWEYFLPRRLHPVVRRGPVQGSRGPSAVGCARSARCRSSVTRGEEAAHPAGQCRALHERRPRPIKYMIFLGCSGCHFPRALPPKAGRGRAVQDRDHPALRPRADVRRLYAPPPGSCPALHRAVLLSLSARSARRWRSRPAPHVRMAETWWRRMRLALPPLRQNECPVQAIHPRPDQRQRVHLPACIARNSTMRSSPVVPAHDGGKARRDKIAVPSTGPSQTDHPRRSHAQETRPRPQVKGRPRCRTTTA